MSDRHIERAARAAEAAIRAVPSGDGHATACAAAYKRVIENHQRAAEAAIARAEEKRARKAAWRRATAEAP